MHTSLAHTRVPSLAQDDRRKPSRSGMNHGRTEAQGRCELEERKARQWECGKWLSRFSERGGGDEGAKAATRKECRKEDEGWRFEEGVLTIEIKGWRMKDGRWRMDDGNGGWRIEDRGWKM